MKLKKIVTLNLYFGTIIQPDHEDTCSIFQPTTFKFSICRLWYFSTSTYTPQQIKKASQWSDDQTYGFESCQDEADEDRFSCFKNTISSTVNNALYAQELVSNQAIDQEIVLEIQIDKEGRLA